MKRKRSQLFKSIGMLLALSMLLAVFAAVAAADTYPSKPVRIIVPFPPGGTTDIIGRLIADELTKRLGQKVFVDNKGGGGGVIGCELASKADPDGYTMLVTGGNYSIRPAFEKMPWDPKKSFTPIARVIAGPMVLVVNSELPIYSVKELLAQAKQKPGELLFATSGIGGSPHMAVELFKMEAGIDFKIVHFKGGGPAMVNLLGGHSHAAINSIPQANVGIKPGKFRVLGTTGAERSQLMPDVPTIAEAGVPGYEFLQWFGMLAPAVTPAPVVDRLNKEIKSMLASDEVKKRFMNIGAEVSYLDSTKFRQFLEREMDKWARVVKKANLKLR